MTTPRQSPEERLDREIAVLLRSPFQRLLSAFLGAAPDGADIASWAKRAPDRWSQALASIARLAGYNDQVAVAVTVADVRALPDAALSARLHAVEAALALAAPQDPAACMPAQALDSARELLPAPAAALPPAE